MKENLSREEKFKIEETLFCDKFVIVFAKMDGIPCLQRYTNIADALSNDMAQREGRT